MIILGEITDESNIDCIVCGKNLPNWEYETPAGDKVEIHPMNGLHFRTYGHYGSTIFDPVTTPEYLDVAICDMCIMKNLEKVRGTGKKELEECVNVLVDALERHG